jgi:hypothetical protein
MLKSHDEQNMLLRYYSSLALLLRLLSFLSPHDFIFAD